MKQIRVLEKAIITESGHEVACHVIRLINIKGTIVDGEFSVRALITIDGYKDLEAFEGGFKPLDTRTLCIENLELQTSYASASAFFIQAVLDSPEFNGSLLTVADVKQPDPIV